MKNASAILARKITWISSKQSYLTARLLVDKDLVDDCLRAYAYFRWADDVIDNPHTSRAARNTFIKRQKTLIDRLYAQDFPADLSPEEMMIADLIWNDRSEDSGLSSFIHNFFAILEFDVQRKGSVINKTELDWYSARLGKAVTDAIQYFIRNGHPYPVHEYRYLAATAAHITHMLRDMLDDTPQGYVNIPREILVNHDLDPSKEEGLVIQEWVKARVKEARELFSKGKLYLDSLDVLRCKIAGYWYCARFEGILKAIERDDFTLRQKYDERRSLSNWLRMVWIPLHVTTRHIITRSGVIARRISPINTRRIKPI